MHRQLDPLLFDEKPKRSHLPRREITPEKLEMIDVAHEMVELKKEVRCLQSHLVKAQSQMESHVKTEVLKWDRLMASSERNENLMNQINEETKRKLSEFSSRLNERMAIDSKIHDTLEHQSQLIQNFDIKLAQLRKLLADKEMQILSLNASLKEARMEIDRIKRHL